MSEEAKKVLEELVGADFKETNVLNLTKAYRIKNDLGENFEAEPENEDERVQPGRWGVLGNKYFPVHQVAEKLRTGVYEVDFAMGMGLFLRFQTVKADELIDLPDSATEMVIEHIRQFWQLKPRFDEMGFLFKRGVLLFGPPGGGKTATVFQIIKFMIEQKGIVIISEYPPETIAGLKMVRMLEPDRPILVVLEDIDTTIQKYGDKGLTNLLDGAGNIENVLYLATTNHPGRLPPRLINRPSRFDIVELVGMPGAAARKAFLQAKTDLSPSELDNWVALTEDLSIAHLKELIILVFIYDKTVEVAVKRLRDMMKMRFFEGNSVIQDVELNIHVKQEPAIVNVEAPEVTVQAPEVKVNIPEGRVKEQVVERDERGLITKVREEWEYGAEEDTEESVH